MVATAKKTAGFLGKVARNVGEGIAANAFFQPKYAIVDVVFISALVWMRVPLF